MARTFALIYFIMVQLVKSVLPTATRGCGRLNLFRFQQLGRLLIVAVWGLVSACSAAIPAREFDRQAIELSLLRTQVAGHGFIHTVYENGKPPKTNVLHVYIGSDGTPWHGEQPSDDPTPRNPLALRLMASDPSAAIYLGRPCYHLSADSVGCNARLWTSARYSPEVIDSMEAALESYLSTRNVDFVRLIGYSGGGCIATLLAPRVRKVDRVVTIAANLDILAWTEHFGYSPLIDSLNPADLPALEPGIRQLHLVGSRDRNVPPQTIERFRNVQSTAEFKSYEDFDHICCWESEWPTLAAGFTEELD